MLEKDFMQEVLKRFDKIDAKLDEHSRILFEHSKEFDAIHKQLDEHSSILDEHSSSIKSLKETVHESTLCIVENSKKIDELSKKIDKLTESVNSHNEYLVKIETEIEPKIGVLFDAYSFNEDKHRIYAHGIHTLNQKTFEHDLRISALENLHKPKLA